MFRGTRRPGNFLAGVQRRRGRGVRQASSGAGGALYAARGGGTMRLGRSRLGAPDGRRMYQEPLIPQLNRMPFTQNQKAVLDAKAFAVQNTAPYIHPGLDFFNPPADADYFRFSPSPFPGYPAVGAGPLVVLAFSVRS